VQGNDAAASFLEAAGLRAKVETELAGNAKTGKQD